MGLCVSGAQAAAELVTNGGFEEETSEWMWEQWEKKPMPGVVDKSDKAGGAASFKMGLPGTSGAREMAAYAKGMKRRGESYLLSFRLKAQDLPQGAARVRITRATGSLIKSDGGHEDVVTTGGTHDWKLFQVPIAAEPEALGSIVVHFIDDQMGQGTLGIDDVSVRVATPEELEQLTQAANGPAMAAPAGPNLVSNGSFEEEMNGWGYEQWSNRPIPGAVDKEDKPQDCPASFKMGIAGENGGRWIAREILLPQADQGYLLSFYIKTQDLPGGAAYVRVGPGGQGMAGV